MTTKTKQTTRELIYEMLTEGTGVALCDSGGESGRHWQQNQKKTIEEFESEPTVSHEICNDEVDYTISVFHYLNGAGLELDDHCNEFNRIQSKYNDWDCDDYYGVSERAGIYLELSGFNTKGDSWNTYNGETNLSQVLQGNYLELDGEIYVLFQIHQGADVRGGYTDAKLFRLDSCEPYLPIEGVYGTIDGVEVENRYNGYSLTTENGQEVPVNENSKIELEFYSNY